MHRSPGNPIRRSRALVIAAAAALALAGCIGGTSADCAALPDEIDLTLTADALEPDDPAACRGQEMTFVVTSETDGVLHVHGYDDELPATEVAAGEVVELAFTAARSGQFPIELHSADDSRGVTVGLFTVHEQ